MNLTAVIPARYASSRFPGKPLALLLGKPMVQHVWNRCMEARLFSRVVIATDDERIRQAGHAFGAEVVLTSPDCASGTDRVAEVASHDGLGANASYVNVQGDEPAVHPDALKALAACMKNPAVNMATLVRALRDDERGNPNVVKVVLSAAHQALYFSRADIPFERDPAHPTHIARFAHVGLYAYRKELLLKLGGWTPAPAETSEALEQLRALHHGVRIACVETPHESVAVDRPEDLKAAEAALRNYASSNFVAASAGTGLENK